jgi:dolichyl-phosphate beta-glucosyltransferase
MVILGYINLKKNMARFSIIIPAYQAEKLITRTLEILLENYNEKIKNGDAEIIVINDGSRDKTQEILEKYTDYITILKNEKNMGKGFSIRKAYLYAQSDYVIYTDADLPYGVESIQKIIDKLIQGRLCVIGEREIVDGN